MSASVEILFSAEFTAGVGDVSMIQLEPSILGRGILLDDIIVSDEGYGLRQSGATLITANKAAATAPSMVS